MKFNYYVYEIENHEEDLCAGFYFRNDARVYCEHCRTIGINTILEDTKTSIRECFTVPGVKGENK